MRSRRLATLAGVLATAVILAGCVGIPTSGGVQTGEVIVGPEGPGTEITPSDPTAGSEKEQLLEDFMLALRGPQNGYQIAKKYLTTEFADLWEPNALTTIRDGEFTIASGGQDELLYTFPSRSFVDANGRYFEQPGASNQTLSFTFERENGEWRISRAPDGIVLSQRSFNIVFRAQPLYFLDPSSEFLVPDARWFPVRDTIWLRVAQSLAAGPAGWLGGGAVLTGFPDGTTIPADGVNREGSIATVTLSDAASAATPEQKAAMRQQLAATLEVSTVVLKVGPAILDSPDVATPPTKTPLVGGQAVIGTADAFGFASADGATPLDGLSAQVVAAAPSAATVGHNESAVALLGVGGVSVVTPGDEPFLLDDRPGLVAPSIDPFNYVWSAQGASAASITAFGLDGAEHPFPTGIPPDVQLTSMDVSRDGARVLLTVVGPLGPRVYVAGVIRGADNAPIGLGAGFGLDVGLGPVTPVDAAWIDERSVAVLIAGADGTDVVSYEVGGPRTSLGPLEGGTAIVGGNFGADGIRVLAGGELWQHRASGWLATGIEALYLATQN